MELKIKKIHPDAIIPNYSNGNAGLDLTAVSIKLANSYIEYGTGIAVEIPKDHVGLLFPRSSVTNTSLMLGNCVGVIDESYRGEIKARFKKTQGDGIYIPGERIAQLVIVKYERFDIVEASSLDSTDRGDKGFGSSNN